MTFVNLPTNTESILKSNILVATKEFHTLRIIFTSEQVSFQIYLYRVIYRVTHGDYPRSQRSQDIYFQRNP